MFPTRAFTDVLRGSPFLSNLSRYGFAAADLLVPDSSNSHCSPFLHSLRKDILSLQKSNKLQPNWSRFVSQGTTTALQKTGIHEENLPLDNPFAAPALEHLWNSRDWITKEMNDVATEHSLLIPKLGKPSVKIQFNSGDGACFPCHFDSDAQVDDRCVTFILYLNPEYLKVQTDPEVAQRQGGHFVAYPIPYPPVSFSPAMGRIVAFSSKNMLHRTLPCRSAESRCCLTLWFPEVDDIASAVNAAGSIPRHSSPALPPSPPPPPTLSLDDFSPFAKVRDDDVRALAILLEPDMRPHLSRLLLAGEWIDSLRLSHTDTAMDVITMEPVEGGVEGYVGTMIQDLHVIEAALVKRVQERGVRHWTAEHLRELSGKLPLRGERHPVSKMDWWK